MLVYNYFMAMFSREGYTDLWFLMLAKTCVYINSAINPILYNAMSVKFRRAFNRALTCNRNGAFYASQWPHYCHTEASYATVTTRILPSFSTTTLNSTMTPPGRTVRGHSSLSRKSSLVVSNSNSPGQNIRLNHLSLCVNGSAHRSDLPTTTAILSPQPLKRSRRVSYNAFGVIVDSSDINNSCHEEENMTQL